LQENTIQEASILDEEINEISNEDILINQNSESVDFDKQTKIDQLEASNLKENIDNEVFEQNEVSETKDQIEIDNIPEEKSSLSPNIEKTNETSVRRLSLFDTISTENKSEDIISDNEVLEKTEPVLASSEEKIEENVSEDNNFSINAKEEFSAEETESSEIEDEFNQETEEELLDIPTFLRRQAN